MYTISDVICVSPTSVEGATVDLSSSTYTSGQSLVYTCLSGLWLTRDTFDQQSTCGSDGQWTPQLTPCKRKLTLKALIYKIQTFTPLQLCLVTTYSS